MRTMRVMQAFHTAFMVLLAGSLSVAASATPATRGPLGAPQGDTGVELDSQVTAVTVYTRSAFVQRTAQAPAGGGTFVLRGLPARMDRDAVRVRCVGAEVTGVETRERLEEITPAARIAELRARIAELEARAAAEEDEAAVGKQLEHHVAGLFRIEERSFAAQLAASGAGDPDVDRAARMTWLGERMSELGASRRALAARRAATKRELEDLRAQLGTADRGQSTRVVDLVVELVDTSGGPATLEAEYLVPDAGWTPAYDLRAPKDLSKVELVYRADVRQQTGEDWTDVELLLSTAQPRRGAQGPEPEVAWLDLVSPAQDRDGWFLGRGEKAGEVAARHASGPSTPGPSGGIEALDEVQVLDEGLTVRYRLPRRETVESRNEASTVLVGRADLAVEVEHVVVPALDATVWLRGRTKNTSPWVLLPGRASVYFGSDFLGQANVPAVQLAEELVLHLGADPGLVVERTVLKEETEESGIFSSRATFHRKLRFRVKNDGGFSATPNGLVAVTLFEAIPRPTDERVEVEISRAQPKPAQGARWDELREEQGVETWVLRVPRGEERVIELETETTYPEDLKLVGG